MNKVLFPKEWIDERFLELYSWFDTCKINIKKSEKGSESFNKWKDYFLKVIRDILDLQYMQLEVENGNTRK